MKRLLAVVALAMLAGIVDAAAQTYPTRPITMIVPFPAGGATDTLARSLAERMKPALGQPIIIENVSGAAGTIGVGRAVRAPADGYTIQIGTSTTNLLTGGLYALSFDLLKDLEPIAQVAEEPMLIVGRKALPPNNLKELIAWLKANPDKASVGIPGIGGMGHLTGLAFQKETGTTFQFVPYRGNGPALQDLVAGQIDLQMEPASNFYTQMKAGTIKAYATTSKARIAAAGDTPTADQAGLPGFESTLWYAMWAPKGTPPAVIARLNAVMVETLADPAIKKRFDELGLQMPPRDRQTPDVLRAVQKADAERWWPFIKAAGIKVQ